MITERVEKLEDLMASLIKQVDNMLKSIDKMAVSIREVNKQSNTSIKELAENLTRSITNVDEKLSKRIEEVNRKLNSNFEESNKELKRNIEEVNKELKRNIEESNKELKRNIEEVNKEFKNNLEESNKEPKRNIEEVNKELKYNLEESNKELEHNLEKNNKESLKRIEESDKKWKQEWGNLAKKMGTLVEDIFLPSIDTFLVKTFNCSITTTAPRIKRHVGSDEMQIDIFVACEDKRVFFIEVKSNPNKVKYIDDFKEDLENFTKFFPEYADYTLIPIYAALNMPESIINRLKKEKIYAIVLKGDVLEIVNLDKISLA